MEGVWLVVVVGVLLCILQLAIGVLLGYIYFGRRGTIPAADARDLERVRTFMGRLYRLTTGVASDVDRHQAQIRQISSDLATVRTIAVPDTAEAVLHGVTRLLEVNRRLQKQLHKAETKLNSQAAQIEAHVLQSRVDPMTGLLNRGAFDEALADRAAAWQLHGLSFCLMMLDLDAFKPLNDHYGHLAGDMALRHVADVLREELTDLDVLARVGGDECAVILPRTALADAQSAAQRICSRIASSRFVFHESELAVTISLGLTVAQAGDDTVSVMKRADDALYASKRAGRNCAHFHDGRECLPLGKPSELAHDAGGSAASGPIQGPSPQDAKGLDPQTVCEELRRRLREVTDVQPSDPSPDQPTPGGTR